MEGLAQALYDVGIATARYQFPYMERGSKRPDPPHVCHATVRAAVSEAARITPDLPLIAGGRSFGGRMTSQTQAAAPLPGVIGLVFFGFPLHPAGKPSAERAAHLTCVRIPMLFLQGDRDELAQPAQLHPVIAAQDGRATLRAIPGADHSFRLPARAKRASADVNAELAQLVLAWLMPLIQRS